jgi:hypothetical protein
MFKIHPFSQYICFSATRHISTDVTAAPPSSTAVCLYLQLQTLSAACGEAVSQPFIIAINAPVVGIGLQYTPWTMRTAARMARVHMTQLQRSSPREQLHSQKQKLNMLKQLVAEN